MEKITKSFGQHYLVEYTGCRPQSLQSVKEVEAALLAAAAESQATMIQHGFHQFEPHGVSGYIFIKESHFSIHTWPEDQYAAFDVLTCGEMYPEKAIDALKGSFQAKDVRVRVFQRGF
jgi:S-adenosylmethionine decarboxylase